jgi:hypothetical protein
MKANLGNQLLLFFISKHSIVSIMYDVIGKDLEEISEECGL